MYITLAVLGVTRWSDERRVRSVFQWVGAFVIAGFGVDLVLAAYGVHLMSAAAISHQPKPTANPLVAGFLLTTANPLTILFWSGVFGAKVAEQHFTRREIGLFSFGCLLATVSFMAAVSAAGAFAGQFLSPTSTAILNTIVGCALVYFAIRLALHKVSKQKFEEV